MTITMYDSIELSTLPAYPEAVAGYVGGSWPDWSAECRAYPNLNKAGRVMSIAVNAGEDAECLDVETGDAVPSQVPSWVRRQHARGVKRPCLYADLSEMVQVLAELRGAGIPLSEVRIWTANPTGSPHIDGPGTYPGFNVQANATQYSWTAFGRNLDASLCDNTFFDTKPAPVKNPVHYDWFYGDFNIKGRIYNERQLVEQYDKYRAHWVLHHFQLVKIREKLAELATRINDIVGEDIKKGEKQAWKAYHRRWRYWQLLHRSQAVRFV